MANPLWDFELVEINLYHAQDVESGNWATGHSEKEALERLKAISPDAANVRGERVRIRRRREPKTRDPKADE